MDKKQLAALTMFDILTKSLLPLIAALARKWTQWDSMSENC